MLNTELLYRHIGRRITDFREAQTPKLSQEELARVLNLSRTSVTNIEAGNQKLSLESAYLICERFGVELTDLLPKVSDVVVSETQPIVVGGESHELDARTAAALERVRQRR